MLSTQEISILRNRILSYQPKFENNRGSRCIPSGLELYKEYNGGRLVWVEALSAIGLAQVIVSHLYYFTPESNKNSLALNVHDRYYFQYPPLYRREAEEVGIFKDPLNDVDHFFFSIRGL